MKKFINKNSKSIFAVVILLSMVLLMAFPAFAENAQAVASENNALGDKAIAAAIAVGLAAAAGAIGMGWAIAKSAEAISRQPEAEGKIRTTLMLGLVFVETAIIYALVIAILIIFVL